MNANDEYHEPTDERAEPRAGDSDRNLLFGIVALQLDLVDREQLVAAMNAWVLAKHRTIGQILVEQGALSQTDRDLLEQMVERHVQLHDGSPRKSLGGLSTIESVRDQLEAIADPDVEQSLACVSATIDHHSSMDATRTYGVPTSTGERFRVLRPHARGGLGEVFVAEDMELHREVALKQIQAWHADNAGSRGRFVLEAEVTGGLEHPGIVPVYGLGQDDKGRPFYAMRFVKGDSLKEAIKDYYDDTHPRQSVGQKMLMFRKLLKRFIDVCMAVEYAHSRGVLHRDLKPGNVMLGKYGETLVVDWGLAKVVGRTSQSDPSEEQTLRPSAESGSAPTEMGRAIGTPAFMSPEQASGELDQLGPASDVYSLGATLFSLLTGRPPFDSSDSKILQKVRQGQFTPPHQIRPGTPRALEAICLKSMSLNPEDRYPNPKDLADDVERWLADEPVSVYREPWIDRATRLVRHHKTAVVGASAILLSALIALAVIAALTRRQNDVLRDKNDELRIAYDTAETNRSRAESEKERAEETLAVARGLTRELLVATESVLPNLEGQGILRRDTLRESLKLMQQLSAEQPENAQLTRELARLHRTYANVIRIEDRDEALREMATAIELMEKLHAEQPDDNVTSDRLAETLRDYGALLKRGTRYRDAAQAFASALDLTTALRQAQPESSDYLRTEATLQLNLGELQRELGDEEQASQNLAASVETFRQLADGPTPGRHDANLLLLALQGRAEILKQLEQLDEAKQVLDEGTERGQRLVQSSVSQPVIPDKNIQHAVAKLLMESGFVSNSQSAADAEAAVTRAIEIWQELCARWRDNPLFPLYQSYLGRALNRRGELRLNDERLDEATADFQQAVEILEPLATKLPETRGNHAAILANQAAVAIQRDDTDGARNLLMKAVALQQAVASQAPESETARQQLERLQSELDQLQ